MLSPIQEHGVVPVGCVALLHLPFVEQELVELSFSAEQSTWLVAADSHICRFD